MASNIKKAAKLAYKGLIAHQQEVNGVVVHTGERCGQCPERLYAAVFKAVETRNAELISAAAQLEKVQLLEAA